MKNEKATLRGLIKRYQGNLSAIASLVDNGLTRQGLHYRLERLGLADRAASERARHAISGPRTPEALDKVKEQLTAAVSHTETLEAARKKLGISRRTLYRRLAEFGLNATRAARLRIGNGSS